MATRSKPAPAKAAKTVKKAVKASPAKPSKQAAAAGRSKAAKAPPTSSVRNPAARAKSAKASADRSPKTRPEPTASIAGFINALADPRQRADSQAVITMMRAATGCEPVLWGSSIVGFDQYHYRYDSGREGDMPIVGFSPRKQALVLYIMPGFARYEALLAKLGRHSTGKSCLYVKRLADVDPGVLDALIRDSVAWMRAKCPQR